MGMYIGVIRDVVERVGFGKGTDRMREVFESLEITYDSKSKHWDGWQAQIVFDLTDDDQKEKAQRILNAVKRHREYDTADKVARVDDISHSRPLFFDAIDLGVLVLFAKDSEDKLTVVIVMDGENGKQGASKAVKIFFKSIGVK